MSSAATQFQAVYDGLIPAQKQLVQLLSGMTGMEGVSRARAVAACARRQVCGTSRIRENCGTLLIRDEWSELKQPCFEPVQGDDNVPCMFESWVAHAGARPNYVGCTKPLARFRSIEVDTGYKWTPIAGGCVLSGNPFVDTNSSGDPLTWADIWGSNGQQYLRPAVTVVDAQERLYSEQRAVPFSNATIQDSTLLYRMSNKDSVRKPYPRNWPQGARLPEDFVTVRVELERASYDQPVQVLSQGYDIDAQRPVSEFFKVRKTASGRFRFKELGVFSNMDALVRYASSRAGTVAVWTPLIFDDAAVTDSRLEFLRMDDGVLNSTTDANSTSIAVVRKSSRVGLAAAVASETDYAKQLELFR